MEIKVLAGSVPSEGCERESALCLSPNFSWFVGIFGIPGLLLHHPDLGLHLYMLRDLCACLYPNFHFL